MDIGKLKNNYTYYEGFEDEREIVLIINDNPDTCMHIWDGYFEFIFGEPALDGKGWHGFTRDYNQMERTFEYFMDEDYVIKNSEIREYLDDLLSYSDKEFEDEETRKCFELMCEFLNYAFSNGFDVRVHVF